MNEASKSLSARQKFSLFAFLYFAQGLPYGFFTQALPVFLREAKTSLAAIGGTALLTLPWALKFLWAPLSDRYGFKSMGLRRSWILPLQALSCILMIGLSFLNPEAGLVPILGAFLLCNLLAAAQDVATDGLAVDLLRDSERGWANGIQVGGYRIGMIVGGSAMLILLSRLGWSGAMISMALLLMISSVPILLLKEEESSAKSARLTPDTKWSHAISGFFQLRGSWWWALLLMTYKFAHQAGSSMMRPWLVDSGYSLEEIASVMGLVGSGAGLTGAVLGGFIAGTYRRPQSLIPLALLQSLATASYLLPILTSHMLWKVIAATAFDNLISGVATVTLFAAMMDRCRPLHSANDYTIQASIVVISQTLASVLGGFSAEFLGYGFHFVLVGCCGFLVFVATWMAIRKLGSLAAPKPLAFVFGAILAGSVFLATPASMAQTPPVPAGDNARSAAPPEIGFGLGPFLPSRIAGVREVLNGWSLRGSYPTSKGLFEAEWFNGRGDGTQYHTLLFDYRLDVLGDGSLSSLPVFFLLGLHIDYFQPLDEPWKTSGGWHYGGGLRLPLGGPISLRTEFKHRFSPGQSMIITVGLSFALSSENSTAP